MIGSALGPYRLDRELGAGGMGKVYAARVEGRVPGLDVGTVVALKVVHPHLVGDADTVARFRREADVGTSIRHANVVATLAAGETAVEDGVQHWLALEYVEGQTLHSLQEELGTVPEELCRHVAHEIAAGLAAIHAAGIVHRDMKPENVIISRCTAPGHDHVAERPGAQRRVSEGNVHHRCDNVVKVMDLGVARGAEDDARVTKTGAFVGSLQYAAPEQFTGGGKGLDGRADLHALGVLLYELATGANPYEDTDWRVVFQRVLKETPRRLGSVNPQVSPFFEEVVHTLLAKDRDQRFASASELASVLAAGEGSPWWASRAKSLRGATKRPLRRVKIPRETALVGRDLEMAKLRAAFERTKTGEGQVVIVEGEAGIGKSRLVDEFAALLQREGEDLDFLHGSYPPGGAATASGAFTTAYREHFGEEGLAETLDSYLKPSPVLIPAFAALLRGETTPAGTEPLTKDSLQTCFVHATRSIAAERIAVVLIDDLHFAPDEGRALFASLAMAVPGHRILLVGTSRPPLDETWVANFTRLGPTTRFQVGRLGARDLVALLKDALRSSHLAEELAVKVAEKTDGNPFFVFEVLRGLKDGQYLTQRPDGTWATTRIIGEIQIPSSIADMVQARVRDLSEDERSLLEIAACVGFEFDPALVGDVAGVGRIPLLKTLGTIEKQHRLIRTAGRRYVFDHHQIQEHLYAGLGDFVREGYHAAIAESLERKSGAASKDPTTLDGALCVGLCEHLLQGAQGERALRYLRPATVHLEKRYLSAQAIALTERALAAPGLLTGVERGKALLRLGIALDGIGRRARQEECAREVERLAEEAGDDELESHAATALGTVFLRTSRLRESEAACRRALDLAAARGDRQVQATALGILSNFLFSLGRLAEAREQCERHLALGREMGDRLVEAFAVGNLGIALHCLGRFAEAREHQERVLAFAREIRDRRGEATACGNLGSVLCSLGRFAEAREHMERHLALAREIGDRMGEAVVLGNLGTVSQSLRRYAEAREHTERGLALSREVGDRRAEAIALLNLGVQTFELGDARGGAEALRASIALCREIGARYPEGHALLGLGAVTESEGDAAAAARLLEASLALRRDIGHGDGVAESLLELSDLRLRAGDADGVRTALDEAVALTREQGAQSRTARCLALLACLPGGDARAAEAALADAGESGEMPETRLALWHATGDRAHLAAARRLFDDALANNPPRYHAAMRTNVRLNREILAACQAEGIE